MGAPPQLLILAAWIAIVLVLLGLGGLVRRFWAWPARDADDLLRSVWLGFAVLIGFLQIWHLFLPVDTRAVVAAASAGACGLVLTAREAARVVRQGLRHWLVLLTVTAVAVWLANLCAGGPRFGDAGLYHIPVVRWIVEYAIVPGLGNLYGPFGHGQSYFLYVAWLDIGPFTRRSFHVANGVLLLLVLVRAVLGAGRLVRRDDGARPADVFYACCMPALVVMAASIYLTSPMPELLLFVLGIVLSGELLQLLDQPAAGAQGLRSLQWLVLLAVTAATMKLSIAGLAVAIALVACVAWMVRARPSPGVAVRTIGGLGMLGGIILVPWVARNIILTGRPFYPSAFAEVPVQWRVTVDMFEWVQSAMQPVPVSTIMRDPSWFLRRLETLGWLDREFVEPTMLALAALVIAVVTRLWLRWRRVPALVSPLILLPTIASLVYTFETTPMPRYAGAAVWLVPIQILVLGCAALVLGAPRRWRVVLVCAVLAYAALPVWRDPGTRVWHASFEPMSRTPVREVTLPTGLVVRVPEKYQTCWDAPPPCTPEPLPGLRLRHDGDLGSGFWIDPSVPRGARAAARS